MNCILCHKNRYANYGTLLKYRTFHYSTILNKQDKDIPEFNENINIAWTRTIKGPAHTTDTNTYTVTPSDIKGISTEQIHEKHEEIKKVPAAGKETIFGCTIG